MTASEIIPWFFHIFTRPMACHRQKKCTYMAFHYPLGTNKYTSDLKWQSSIILGESMAFSGIYNFMKRQRKQAGFPWISTWADLPVDSRGQGDTKPHTCCRALLLINTNSLWTETVHVTLNVCMYYDLRGIRPTMFSIQRTMAGVQGKTPIGNGP